jgi:hypothetical protein
MKSSRITIIAGLAALGMLTPLLPVTSRRIRIASNGWTITM